MANPNLERQRNKKTGTQSQAKTNMKNEEKKGSRFSLAQQKNIGANKNSSKRNAEFDREDRDMSEDELNASSGLEDDDLDKEVGKEKRYVGSNKKDRTDKQTTNKKSH